MLEHTFYAFVTDGYHPAGGQDPLSDYLDHSSTALPAMPFPDSPCRSASGLNIAPEPSGDRDAGNKDGRQSVWTRSIRRRPFRISLITIALGVAAQLASPIARAASDPAPTDFASLTPEQVYAAKTAVTHDEMMTQMGASETSTDSATATTAASGCLFASDGDHVHTSTYSGVLYASGHGYWWNTSCPTSYRADVTIWLEEKLGTSWYPQGNAVTGYNRAPGSGSAQRVTAKMECVNTTTHEWRSIVVADIVGHADTAPTAYTAAQSLACY